MPRTQKRSPQASGKLGEMIAQTFLEGNGYTIIDTNVHFGKTSGVTGELDIVAWEGGILCFIEVKTRQTTHYDLAPAAAVTPQKQKQLARLATLYALQNDLLGDGEISLRFDVVAILLGPLSQDSQPIAKNIQLIRGAFLINDDIAEP